MRQQHAYHSCVLFDRGRNAARVSEAEPLDSVFKLFMTSANHMLLAHDDDSNVTGLLTLEDVIEELIQACHAPLHSAFTSICSSAQITVIMHTWLAH